ncbi:MAG: aminotransferase class III-fold pyridoxal phosphate-dependent enzyme, partial [Anaerolineales bacterium]|nr:aminotransferase class III-fold pyridoxal phosphate-dependent enzyme [Anaerolineales bacterium]
AHQAYGVTPDLMTLAKPLAGGLPIGVTLMTEAVAAEISAGDHGSTFGAGPLVCSAALAVFNQINQPAFLTEVAAKGEAMRQGLHALPTDHIVEVRGAGLLIGVEFEHPVKPIIQAALDRGLVVINAGENVLRICPPLTIGYAEIEAGLDILSECLAAIERAA